MKIKITRATVAGGKSVFVGEVIEANERDADLLLKLKKAVIYEEDQKIRLKKRVGNELS